MTYFRKNVLLLFTILCLLGITGLVVANPKMKAQKTTVIAAKASLNNKTEYREILGQVVTPEGGLISAEVAGIVQEVLVKIGQTVTKGDIIVQLNQDRLKLELNSAKTNLNQSQAFLESEQASLELAKLQLNREQSLKNSPAFSKATYENRLQEFHIAKANLAQAKSQYQTSLVNFELAALNLNKSAIKAPFAGIVTNKMIHPGLYVKVGDSIIELQNTKALEIEVNIPNSLINYIKIGDVLEINDRENSDMQARIIAIVAKENTASRTIPIRLEPNAAAMQNIILNQSIIVRLPSSASSNTITINKDALVNKNDKFYVFKIVNDKAEFTPVTIGAFIQNKVEILSGINVNDIIVVRGNERLRHMQDIAYRLEP